MSQVRPMIKGLAAHMQALTEEVSQEINKLSRQQDTTNELLAALIEVVGRESVEAAMKAARTARAQAYEEAQDAATLKMVEFGALAPAEAVGPESLVVGTDTLKDGSTRKVRFELKPLAADQKAPFVGKKAGDVIVNEKNNTSFEITAIYTIDEAKVEEMVNPKPAVVETADDIVEDGVPVVQEGAVVVKGKKGKKSRKARA